MPHKFFCYLWFNRHEFKTHNAELICSKYGQCKTCAYYQSAKWDAGRFKSPALQYYVIIGRWNVTIRLGSKVVAQWSVIQCTI